MAPITDAPDTMPPAERGLRQLCAAAGIATLAELARRAHVEKHAVYDAARKTRRTRATTITKLASALGVTEDIVRRTLGGAT